MNCTYDAQWAAAASGNITFDADIVGIGVLLSFIISAFTAFIVTVVGYLTFSLPDNIISYADDEIARDLRLLFDTLTVHRFTRYWTWLDTKKWPESMDDEIRKARVEGLRDFMLAISDQQLVTGFAMLIAAFARYSDITVYSMDVVAALVFFSASVHLDTLDVILEYLREHNVVKSLRAVLMLSTLIGLIFISVLQLSTTWGGDCTECDLYFRCGFWDMTLSGADLVGELSAIYVIFYLALGYADPLFSLYTNKASIMETVKAYWEIKYKTSELEDQILFDYQERAKQRLLKSRSGIVPPSEGIVIAQSFAFHEAHNSKAWHIGYLLYGLIYGTLRIYITRADANGTTGPMNTMGFGQIVPLALLLLPIFAAVEGIYGYRDARCNVRSEQDRNPSSSPPTAAVGSATEMQTLSAPGIGRYSLRNPSGLSPPDRLNDLLTQEPQPISRQEADPVPQGSSSGSTMYPQPGVFMRRPTASIAAEATPSQLTPAGLASSARTDSFQNSSANTLVAKNSSGALQLSPVRKDTVMLEKNPRLNDLLDANKDNLLAKFICENPRKSKTVKGWMYFWLLFFYVLQALLAVASAGYVAPPVLWVLLFLIEVRYWFRFVKWFVKVRRNAKKPNNTPSAT